jgi:serine-type D-Ala-D-Ala carboxypeptidase (penicillin-binding protein 5/6)
MMKKILMLFMMIFYLLSLTTDADAEELPLVSEAAVLMDTESGAILFGKNEDMKMYPASLTKIATAIYALEKGNLNDQVTVSEAVLSVDGTKVYLNPGEQVPLKKLIQGMLINSGNDAALMIALHLDGSMQQYSQNINQFLESKIGVKDTHFMNASGLFHKDHYTTARDLGTILNYAMKNHDFREIFGTKQLDWDGETWDTTIFSHHRMVKGEIPYEGVTGGKTGFVDQSKQTLATTADNGQIKLSAILLKSEYKRKIYDDTIALFEYGFANFKSSQINKDEEFNNGKLRFISEKDYSITEPIGQVVKSVNSDGVLTIKNENGQTIQSLKLTAVNPEKITVKKTTQKPEQNGVMPLNSMIGGLLFLMAGSLWMLNRKQKRNRKYRSR